MNSEKEIENIARNIFKCIFNADVKYSLDEIKQVFAFDMELPKKVYDSTTNEETYATSVHGGSFITLTNMEKVDSETGWMRERREIHSLQEIVDAWNDVNYITTERNYDSENVYKSDTIYSCEWVYNSQDSTNSKRLIFCDSCHDSESLIASSRSVMCTNSIRCDDSKNCSNSYNIVCSNKIMNSFFIQDSFDLYECMFCSHIANKRFCIANMQFDEDKYYQIKEKVIEWILKIEKRN